MVGLNRLVRFPRVNTVENCQMRRRNQLTKASFDNPQCGTENLGYMKPLKHLVSVVSMSGQVIYWISLSRKQWEIVGV